MSALPAGPRPDNPLTPVAVVEPNRSIPGFDPAITVWVEWPWAGVDRPRTMGWTFTDTPRNRRLADRLALAVVSGAVLTEPAIVADVNGATYVEAHNHVLGRTANADLRRLGY